MQVAIPYFEKEKVMMVCSPSSGKEKKRVSMKEKTKSKKKGDNPQHSQGK
jgi:hypothetical protein